MAKESSGPVLVIVESPTKARTIEKFLGDGYEVRASNGHIRDLPNSQSEVPEKFKKESWKDTGVNVEDNFWPLYVVPESKKQGVRELKKSVKSASEIYLATDEDREGESISWHLLEELKPKGPVKRLVFHEITKDAIQHALDNPREIDMALVEAQETRRIVDRLFGYRVSPLLWKKMARGLSAGRVQSVAVRLLVERERARIAFHTASYWGLKATFAKNEAGHPSFEGELTHVDGRRIAIGKDFDPDTGKLREGSETFVLQADAAAKLVEEVRAGESRVATVEEKPFKRSPAPPYVTSTLQQDGNSKLRYSARRTMGIAQQLYENGFITYMRTDSTTLSSEALTGARNLISERFGADYLPAEPRVYKTKVKNAQEAHEAIRPAGQAFTDVAVVERQLGPDAGRLYRMIWQRTLASQMPDARGTNVSVAIENGRARFRSSGKTVEFPGFLAAYTAGAETAGAVDLSAELGGKEKVLPKLVEAETVKTAQADAVERSTQPPARYTEGSLIKELERLGIGRPSTWATIVDLVLSRSYAFKKGTALAPTFTAMAVVALLEDHFTYLLDYEFTARLEDDLDAISRGEADRDEYLQRFYFGGEHAGLKALVEQGEVSIDPRKVCGIPLGESPDGEKVEVRIGRYGPFLASGESRVSVPDDLPPDELNVQKALELIEIGSKAAEALGQHPETGEPVYLKSGRFGPYVQMGEGGKDADKPKMASLLPGMKPDQVDLELAVKLLSLPREIGPHPDDQKPVLAANGRFGPYVKWGEEIRSIPEDGASPLEIGLEAAVELLRQPKARRKAAKPSALATVGKHPVSEIELKVLSGRFGPYVTDGEVNASLPRGKDPESLTVDEAVELLEARKARLAAGGGVRGRKKAAKKKAAKKKTSKKKSTKTAAKKAS